MSPQTVAFLIAWSVVPMSLGLYFWWIKRFSWFGISLFALGYFLASYAGLRFQGSTALPVGLEELWATQTRRVQLFYLPFYLILTVYTVVRYLGRDNSRSWLSIIIFGALLIATRTTLAFFTPF